MKNEKKKTSREKILHSACGLFALNGFNNTTIQDICQDAGMNIASVNYYFGSKEKLYQEIWEYALQISLELNGKPDDSLPPLEWMGIFLEQRIQSLFDDGPAGWLPRLLFQDHENHDSENHHIHIEVLKKLHQQISAVLSNYMGPKASDIEIQVALALCHGILPGLAINIRQLQCIHKGLISPTSDELKQITSLSWTYAKAGLMALKKHIEEKPHE